MTDQKTSRQTSTVMSSCCLLGALVLAVFAVVNASQQPPATTAAWVEGVLAVLLAGVGLQLRGTARRAPR